MRKLLANLGTLSSTIYNDRTGEKHPKLYIHIIADLTEAIAYQRGTMQLTCNGSNLNYSRHSPTPTPTLPQSSFLSEGQGEWSDSQKRELVLLVFLWPNIGAISAGAPKLQPPLFPFSPITDFTWFLVKAFRVFGSCTHCKRQSPLLSPTGAEETKKVTRGAVRHQSHQNPSGLFPKLLTAAKMSPQLSPGEPGYCPAS